MPELWWDDSDVEDAEDNRIRGLRKEVKGVTNIMRENVDKINDRLVFASTG